jgi:hypothetical protein
MMSSRGSGDEKPWHPPLGLQRHGLRWLFMPVIAFAIFAVGPSVLSPIAYIVGLVVHLSSLTGLPPRLPDPITLLLEPLILTLALWPFLWLYGETRDRLIEQPAEWRSLRLATIGATLAMGLPSAIFLVAVPGELMSPGPDAGEGIGILCFLFMFLLPPLGAIGWLIGRGIAWMLRY